MIKIKKRSTVNSETGHVKNVANFEVLVNVCTSLGAVYNPSVAYLKLPALNTLLTQSRTAIANVTTSNVAYNNNVNIRQQAFASYRSLSQRLFATFKTTSATPQLIADAKTVYRKMQGQRAKAIILPSDPNTPAPNTISVSQLSYDNRVQHLSTLVEILKLEPTYAPNETDLKITSLTTLISNLKNYTTNVSVSHAGVTNNRSIRNTTLYSNNASLVATAVGIKKYIKAVFGPQSPQYKQVQSIKFVNFKK